MAEAVSGIPSTVEPDRDRVWHQLLGNPPAMVGLFVILVFVLAAIFAPLVAPYDPGAGDFAQAMRPPSSSHLMGTDSLGRDVFSRVLYGARPSLLLGLLAVAVGLVIGIAIGTAAGGGGARLDFVLMRLVDVLLAIPGILLAILIVAWLGGGALPIMFAIGLRYARVFARLLRGSLLALQEEEFVVAARASGASNLRVLLRHMLPNALSPLIVEATLSAATAIVDVASIGFLGLGPGDPRIPEWGEMLTDSSRFLQSAPHLILFPGAAIALTAIGFNLLGDGLRESLDPRLRR